MSEIRLDVGGTLFLTSRHTLTDRDPSSLLAEMFRNFPDSETARPTSDGSCFVDRDGTHFNYILEYLRSGSASRLPADVATARQVLCEAKFYRLKQLVKRIEDWLVERNASII